jgi:hypothetical protein
MRGARYPVAVKNRPRSPRRKRKSWERRTERRIAETAAVPMPIVKNRPAMM